MSDASTDESRTRNMVYGTLRVQAVLHVEDTPPFNIQIPFSFNPDETSFGEMVAVAMDEARDLVRRKIP